jgi:hypothetical protein
MAFLFGLFDVLTAHVKHAATFPHVLSHWPFLAFQHRMTFSSWSTPLRGVHAFASAWTASSLSWKPSRARSDFSCASKLVMQSAFGPAAGSAGGFPAAAAACIIGGTTAGGIVGSMLGPGIIAAITAAASGAWGITGGIIDGRIAIPAISGGIIIGCMLGPSMLGSIAGAGVVIVCNGGSDGFGIDDGATAPGGATDGFGIDDGAASAAAARGIF